MVDSSTQRLNWYQVSDHRYVSDADRQSIELEFIKNVETKIGKIQLVESIFGVFYTKL